MTSYSMPPAPEEEGASPVTIMLALIMFAVLCLMCYYVYDLFTNPSRYPNANAYRNYAVALAALFSLVFLFFVYKIM